jgi:hypothetical protein
VLAEVFGPFGFDPGFLCPGDGDDLGAAAADSNQPGAGVGGVDRSFHVACPFEPVHQCGRGLFGHLGLLS